MQSVPALLSTPLTMRRSYRLAVLFQRSRGKQQDEGCLVQQVIDNLSRPKSSHSNRTLNTGVGNKIVLRGYEYEPIISEADDGVLAISTGDPCDGAPPLIPDPDSPNTDESSTAASTYLGWGLASMFLSSRSALAGSTLALGMTVGFLSSAPTALAEQSTISECDLAPIEVEIYVDTMASEIVQMEYQTGDFEICPPESKLS